MKLLLDFNLSPKLIPDLAELFPGSKHLSDLRFAGETPDRTIWDFAGQNAFTILTSDRDFLDLAEKFGPPPKVVRFENMNYRTRFALELVRRNAIRISEFGMNGESVLIVRSR